MHCNIYRCRNAFTIEDSTIWDGEPTHERKNWNIEYECQEAVQQLKGTHKMLNKVQMKHLSLI